MFTDNPRLDPKSNFGTQSPQIWILTNNRASHMRDAPLTPPPCPSLLLCAPSQLTHVTLSTRSVPHLCSVLALAGHNLRIPFTCQARGQKHIAYYEPGQPTPSASESGPGLTREAPWPALAASCKLVRPAPRELWLPQNHRNSSLFPKSLASCNVAWRRWGLPLPMQPLWPRSSSQRTRGVITATV